MAKRKKTTSKKRVVKKKKNGIVSFFRSKQTHLVFGVLVFTSAIFLFVSYFSFFMHWKEDQSILEEFSDKSLETQNLLGKIGASVSDFMIYDGFGISTFVIPILSEKLRIDSGV